MQRDVTTELKWEPTIHATELVSLSRMEWLRLAAFKHPRYGNGLPSAHRNRVSGVKGLTEEIKVTVA